MQSRRSTRASLLPCSTDYECARRTRRRERANAGLTEQHAPCSGEPADNLRIRFRHAIGKRLSAPAGGDAGGVEYVFRAIGNSVQRPQPGARGQ